MAQRCEIERPGLVAYPVAWARQRQLLMAVQEGASSHQFILLEHPPTFTLGRGGHNEFLLASDEMLAERGAQVFHVDRGGDITYHGPGQIVGYPILNLRALWGRADVLRYVCSLQEVLAAVLAEYGIVAGPREGSPGVWVGNDKIAAIGVRVSRGVTMHGFALNVATDMSYFDMIVPCGIRDGGVTSMERLLGTAPEIEEVTERIIAAFGRAFDLTLAMAEAVQG